LDEKNGILVEQQSEVDKDTCGAVRLSDTITFNQLSNNDNELLHAKNLTFSVEPAQFEDITRDDASFFGKGLYVDQAALSQLTDCEIAVLDEKKGVLIIPMAPE